MEIKELIDRLLFYADAWEADPQTYLEAASTLESQQKRIEELEAALQKANSNG